MNLPELSDEQLAAGLNRAVAREAQDLADVLEHLAEFDRRRLAERKAFPSLFQYCTTTLGYSESAAGKRICAARLAAKHRRLFELIRSRKMHLEGLVMLSPVINEHNVDALIEAASGKSKREVERIVAALAPCEPSFDLIRRFPQAVTVRADAPTDASAAIPADAPTAPTASAAPHDFIKPVSALKLRVAFTASEGFVAKLESVRSLLRHKHPHGDLEPVFDQALDALLSQIDPLRPLGPERAAEAAARRIPRVVRYKVWKRDDGRCTFKSADGRRCQATSLLQFDHVEPWALGGVSNDPGNIRLLCAPHNRMLARERFGARPKAA